MRKVLFVVLCLLFTSCNDEYVNNKYCSLPARFTFDNTYKVSQLHTSCNNPGEWCSIIASGNNYLFTKPDGSQGEWPRTELDNYTGFYMGLSGFIVGKPFFPELGEPMPVVTCYDLACSNCWEDFTMTRRLTFQAGGYVLCSNCLRTYDLNNTGIVSSGEAGKPLYRYRVYYGNNTLSINNR